MWSVDVILPVLAVSALSGLLAGLLGVGGGLMLVPIVLWVLHLQGLDSPYAQHIAVGTSFLVMVCTSLSSAWAQHKKGAVRWDIVRRFVPGLLIGVALGSLLARWIPSRHLQLVFIVFAAIAGVQTLLQLKPKATRQLPGSAGLSGAGGVIGLLSSWIGIGGGTFSMPFMLYCNVPVREVVGTSAALGWPIAVTGAVTYLVSGWGAAGLPAGMAGFSYPLLAALMAVCTVTVAPQGVKLSHKLPPERLKQLLGVLLLILSGNMLYRWLGL